MSGSIVFSDRWGKKHKIETFDFIFEIISSHPEILHAF